MNLKHVISTLWVVGMASSCSHTSPTKNILSSDFLAIKGTQQLTFLGDNARPRFSPDGERIIFSRSNNGHKHSQIYELNWRKNTERRVTFSDGDSFDPFYLTDNEIVYASTTDEIKERPLQNSTIEKDNPPSDLYMSDLYGTRILRMTRQPGYDGQGLAVTMSKDPYLIFSSQRGEIRGLFRLNLNTTQVQFLNVEKGKRKESPATTGDFKKLAWLETDNPSSPFNQIMIASLGGQGPRVLKSEPAHYRDLFFSPGKPDRLYYSVLRQGEIKYHLESYDLEHQCTQVIFKGSDSLFAPTLSHEGKLAFVRDFQGKGHIYLADLPLDLGPCLEASHAAKLEE